MKTSIQDHIKLSLWCILIPYLVNVKSISEREIFHILEEWLDECSKKRKIDFNANSKYIIKTNLRNVKDFLPTSKDNLKE